MAKQYKIIKATYEKLVGVIFECAILNNMSAPKWFSDFEVRNNARFDKIEGRLDKLEIDVNDLRNKVNNLDTKLTTVIKHNNLKTE